MSESQMELQPYQTITATVQIRETANGGAIKPNVDALALNGKRLKLEVLWRIEDDDSRYPGEWALGPGDSVARDLFNKSQILWIASGDVVLLAPELPELTELRDAAFALFGNSVTVVVVGDSTFDMCTGKVTLDMSGVHEPLPEATWKKLS